MDTSLDIKPKRKKRRTQNDVEELNHHHHRHISQNAACHVTKRWSAEREQPIYSSKLLQAIRNVRRRSLPAKAGKEIRNAADRLLAVSTKGATRWSRAILSSPLGLRLKKRRVKVKDTGCSRLRRKPEDVARMKNKKLPVVQMKLRVLSRLIPGCQKVSSLNLLEEASDYISALEMQVRAMTALTAVLAVVPPADAQLVFSVRS